MQKHENTNTAKEHQPLPINSIGFPVFHCRFQILFTSVPLCFICISEYLICFQTGASEPVDVSWGAHLQIPENNNNNKGILVKIVEHSNKTSGN